MTGSVLLIRVPRAWWTTSPLCRRLNTVLASERPAAAAADAADRTDTGGGGGGSGGSGGGVTGRRGLW